MLEYTGTFEYTSDTDKVRRTWHLWGEVDDEGEVVAIHYGISSNFQCASGEVLKADCDSTLRKKAFAIAKEQLENPEPDDFEVIDQEDHRRIQ
ncbi:MAG: hypothetical protein ACI92I_000967 [Acidimicrobiales bacterium]|jgi:hypothetical protein